MKKSVFLILGFFLIALNLFGQISTKSNYLITNKTAGIFKLGQSIDSLIATKKWKISKETRTEEGEDYYVYLLVTAQGDKLEFLSAIDNSKRNSPEIITSITTLSPNYKTIKNIGAGSKLSDLLKKYKNCSLVYSNIADLFFVDSEELPTIRFFVDSRGFINKKKNIHKSDTTDLRLSDFSASAKLEAVRIN